MPQSGFDKVVPFRDLLLLNPPPAKSFVFLNYTTGSELTVISMLFPAVFDPVAAGSIPRFRLADCRGFYHPEK